MSHEVDFLAVGNGDKSGDAIALRFGNLADPNQQTVIVYDGGTQESGKELAAHIKKYYNTDYIDYVFSSHPDNDHSSGLISIIEELRVGTLLMHRPWDHADEIKDLFKDGRLTENGLELKIAKSLQSAKDLESLAVQRGIRIIEPFAGEATDDGIITVLGPTQDYYQSLIPNFRGTPEPIAEASMFQKIITVAEEAVKWVEEALDIETLDEKGETSAENNSSVILFLNIDGKQIMLTGDAGIPALAQAAEFAAHQGITLSSLSFFQVPHHGSKRNVSPSILNQIKSKTAFISASPKGAPKHPAKKVTNALIRRGCEVHSTVGQSKRHHHNAPPRAGWSASTPIPFYGKVEE